MHLRTAFLWLLIGSLTVAAGMGVAVLLLPRFFAVQGEVIGSAAIVSAFSLVGLICAIGLDRHRVVPVMWAGIAGAIAAVAIWLTIIWTGWRYWSVRSDVCWALSSSGWTATSISVWAALTAALLLRPPDRRLVQRLLQGGAVLTAIAAAVTIAGVWIEPGDWFWVGLFGSYATLLAWTGWFVLIVRMRLARRASRSVQLATCAAGSALALWLVFRSWDVPWTDEDLVMRAAGVMLILTAAGSIIAAILPRLDRTAEAKGRESLPQRTHMEIVCPRCQERQEVAGGHSRCRACGLRFEIGIEEPRCTCGYLLHMLQGDACPECGRVIPPADRWAARGRDAERSTAENAENAERDGG